MPRRCDGDVERRRARRRRRLHRAVDRLAPERLRPGDARGAARGRTSAARGRAGATAASSTGSGSACRRCASGSATSAAIEIARAAQRSVAEIGGFCDEQGVDAWFRQAGYLQVSTAPAWDGAWRPAARACAELGEPEACCRSTRRRCAPLRLADLPRRRLLPGAATVQPARLSRGLRRPRARGAASRSTSTRRSAVVRRGGEVVAEAQADGCARGPRCSPPAARSPGYRGMRHRLTLTSSHMVDHRAGPRPARGDRLDRGRVHHRLAGDGPLLPDHPGRPDRLRLGRGPGRARRPHPRPRRARPGRDRRGRAPHASASSPGSRAGGSTHAWGGPIDVSPSHLPVIVELERRDPLRLRLHRPRGRAVAPARPLARLAGARHRRRGQPPRAHQPAAGPGPAGAVSLPRRLADPAGDPAPGGRAGAGRRARPCHRRPSPRSPERIGIHIGR